MTSLQNSPYFCAGRTNARSLRKSAMHADISTIYDSYSAIQPGFFARSAKIVDSRARIQSETPRPNAEPDLSSEHCARGARLNRARARERERSQSREEKVERALSRGCPLSRARLTRVLV